MKKILILGPLLSLGFAWLLFGPSLTQSVCGDGSSIKPDTGIVPLGGIKDEYVIGLSIHPGAVEGEMVAQLWVGTVATGDVFSPVVEVFQDKVVLNWEDKVSVIIEKCGVADFRYKVLETEEGFVPYQAPARWRSEELLSG